MSLAPSGPDGIRRESMHRRHRLASLCAARLSRLGAAARGLAVPALAGLLLLLAPLAAAADPVAQAARVVGDDQQTRFVLDLDAPVDFVTFTLADPYRVVIDLPEIEFALPPDAGSVGRGLVTEWRYGLFATGKSRIILDLAGPAVIEEAYLQPSVEGLPARVVVSLGAATREAFLAAQEQQAVEPPSAPPPPEPQTPAGPRTRPLVVLDPGHGGFDPGASGPDGVIEKDITLAFALAMREALEDTGAVDVILTREDDRYISPGDRMIFAREQHADLLISIHADSLRQTNVRGTSVYTLSERASDQVTAQLAEQENRSVLLAGLQIEAAPTAVADILLDLTRMETRNLSVTFARALIEQIGETTSLLSNPHREDNFAVLRAPEVPSVLVELGFLSNTQDEAQLASAAWQRRVAAAMAAAVEGFTARQLAAWSG